MSRKTRRRFFYLLVLIFLIAGPLLVARSFGYTFDFSNRTVEQTGGIFVRSQTGSASVFLDTQFIKETSFFSGGALLTEVEPGMHLIRLEKSGLQPWSKAITVQAGAVTELRFILLIPYDPPIATSTQVSVLSANLFPSIPPELSLSKIGILTEKNGKTQRILASNIHSFTLTDTAIIAITNDGMLETIDRTTTRKELITRPGFHLKTGKPVTFILSSSGEIALLDSEGSLFLLSLDNTLALIDTRVTHASFDRTGEKLLIVKNSEIVMLWLADNPFQPFERRGTKEMILELTESPIRNALWFYQDNAHVIIHTDNGAYMTEIDGRGGKNTNTLFSGRKDELFTSPDAPDYLFYREGSTWYEMRL